MSNFTLAQLKKAYDATLEQTAAESFLFQGMAPQAYIDALRRGNNPLADPGADNLDGKLRMTLEQAQVFRMRYRIIDAYQNDATGFSAVALRDNDTPNRVVIAVRSTELINDRTRDLGADLQIFTSGFAFDQILSAQDFLARVRPQLQPEEKIDVVGYSLSGNIVRTLAAMYPDIINQDPGGNVVFNATGLGGFSDPTGQNRSRSAVLQEMMDLYRQVEADPSSATDVSFLLQPLQFAAIAASPIDRTDPSGNVYPSPRQDFAQAYIQNKYSTFYNDLGTTVAEPSFTQYVGVALSGFDANAVANSGSHPAPIGIAIEGQPVVEIPGVASRFDYLNTHSLTLIADSLRLQILFKEIDPTVSTDTIQAIFQASSASAASTLLGRAEKDTLENALDAVRRALLPMDQHFEPTPSTDAPGGFGNIANRSAFHGNIAAVEAALPPQASPYRIETLVDRSLEEVKGNALLNDAIGKGLAYRYALTVLNPFVIIGPTYEQHNVNGELALFDPRTGLGSITADYIQDRGLFLQTKLVLNQANLDRPLNPFALTHYHDNTTGYDIPSGLSILPGLQREYVFGSDSAETISGGILFASDHLYGGDGADTLLGHGGTDYLQGDAGNDILDGGSGADRMLGGQGDDTYVVDDLGDQVLEGADNGSDTVQSSVSLALGANVEDLTLTGTDDLNGEGNNLDNLIIGNDGINRLEGKNGRDHLIGGGQDDILIGGLGDDLLEGGEGLDTYYYNIGDGTDQIEDTDATGRIIFNGRLLVGGVRKAEDPADTYKSPDGVFTYVMSGGHLIVNGVLTINADFESGQFGIQLDELSDYLRDTGPPTGPFEDILIGGDGGEQGGNPLRNGPLAIYGNGGNDAIVSSTRFGGSFADGGEGDDLLHGGSGPGTRPDYLVGGPGDDYGTPGSQGIFLGGEGNDVGYAVLLELSTSIPTRYSGPVYMDGEAGDDQLSGSLGGDVLKGGDDDDILRGENIPSGWTARIGLKDYYPATGAWEAVQQPQELFSASGGADFLDGGAGDDLIVGDGGDDIVWGGPGDDRLYGDDETGYRVEPGADLLDGGDGSDILSGGDGNDSLSGGTGADRLYGDLDDDILDGGEGADTMFGGDGADELYGGAGDDLVVGDGLNNEYQSGTAGADDFLDGGDGNDVLEGGIGDDTLFGGAGRDVLFGQDGNDLLFGDEGDDELQGMVGDDLLRGGTGNDRLFGQEGADTIFGDTGDDTLSGGDGNDVLIGGNGVDIVSGGHGDDQLIGGQGFDGYLFDPGDGRDTITDTVLSGAENIIQFGVGITLESLTFLHNPLQQTLTIQVSGSDSITLLGFDPNTFNYVIDRLSFGGESQVSLADRLPLPGGLLQGSDDDNVIRSGAGNDTILAGAGHDSINAGAGNDMMLGESGNDSLAGGAGADTYIFNAGDGTDTVLDTAGEGNRLVFGPGISAGAVALGVTGESSLAIRTGVAGDAIHILHDVFAGDRPSIDRLEFADGTALSIDELLEQGIEINGTAGSDTLTGTALSDRISGGAGDDIILGGLGADILRGEDGDDLLLGQDGPDQLDGGSGSDVLEGGAGEDTYIFGRGYGQDVLRDSPVEQSGPNTIQLTSGIAPHEVRLQARSSEDGTTVVLTIVGTQDALTLLGASDPSLLPISRIRFADGTSWDTAEIVSRIEGVRVTASATGSSLMGTGFRDELIGAQGNDDLDGLSGPDRMVGGAGDDRYRVDHIGDTVVETTDGGTDTVLSLIDYVLPSNVENLFLRSTGLTATDPVRGEGNAGANLLLGNFVSNVLIGGEGADTLWGGFSVGGDYGQGNDDLHGGIGSDTYVIESDFNGFDTIHDIARPGEGNRLQFGSTVRPEDLLFVQEGSALRMTNSGGAHGVILADFDPHGVTGSLVTEVVAFSGGVEDVTGGYETSLLAVMNPMVGTDQADALTGTSNAEVLRAHAGDDVLMGGSGNDVLIGGTGSDVYVFHQGDGFDLIDDHPGLGEMNWVQFGSGITPDMLRVVYSGTFGMGGLTVRIGSSGDGLHFLGASAEDQTEPHAVDEFHFADGTQLTFAQLFEHEVLVQGTGRSDGELFGTFAHDRLLGLGGSETLSAGAGDDTLIGGAGHDVLDGGEGSDTYLFNTGDGMDVIQDDAGLSDVNRLRFGTGITVNDLTSFDAGDGFTVNRIEIGTAGDAILLPNVIGYRPGLTVAEFADGVTLDLYDLHAASRVTTSQTILGDGREQVLLGGLGNDTILAGTAATTMIGLAGHDTLIGGAAADLLMGGRGDDRVQGGAGNDTYLFNLGDGVDTIADVVTAGEGNRILFGAGITRSDLTFTHDEVGRTLRIHVGGNETDKLVLADFDPTGANGSLVVEALVFSDGSQVSLASLFGSTSTVYGTDGSEVMVGTANSDDIDAGNGDDTVYGHAGDDRIVAGAGVDSVSGDEGADRLFGGGDTDYLSGGEGDDLISGEDGSDVVVGDAGNDTLSGGDGNDTLNGGVGADQLRGEEGDDTLYVDAADAEINGGTGYDVVTVVGTESVTLNATTAEVEFVAGNSGNDVFTAVGSLAGVTFYGGEGNDQLTGGDGNDVLVGQAGADLLIGGVGHDILNGGEGDDTLTGGEGSDTFYAGMGHDQISGGDGDDTVSGDEGADTISGGHGGDYLYGGEGDDLIHGDEGHDILVGEGGNDRLRGGSGNDVLNGGADADQLVGEDGDDTLYIDAADTVINCGTGYDVVTVVGAEAVTLNATAAEVEFVAGNSGNDVFTAVGSLSGVTFYGGEGDDQLTGGDGNDVLVGQAGADLLIGGVGHDILNGGEGDDTLTGGEGSDTFYAGMGHDQISGGDGDDSVSGDEGDDTIVGGAGSDYLYGGDGVDIIAGNEGNDVLVGNTGNDTLAGGLGNDYLAGGTGDDRYLFMRGDGADTIAEDGVNIDHHDVLQLGNGIASLDLVISRQANDLRVAIHGTSDHVTIENWYLGDAHQVKSVQIDNGQALLNTQVDQLIQAMAAFTEQSGLSWDQAIDQRPQDVQAVLAASWQ